MPFAICQEDLWESEEKPSSQDLEARHMMPRPGLSTNGVSDGHSLVRSDHSGSPTSPGQHETTDRDGQFQGKGMEVSTGKGQWPSPPRSKGPGWREGPEPDRRILYGYR